MKREDIEIGKFYVTTIENEDEDRGEGEVIVQVIKPCNCGVLHCTYFLVGFDGDQFSMDSEYFLKPVGAKGEEIE